MAYTFWLILIQYFFFTPREQIKRSPVGDRCNHCVSQRWTYRHSNLDSWLPTTNSYTCTLQVGNKPVLTLTQSTEKKPQKNTQTTTITSKPSQKLKTAYFKIRKSAAVAVSSFLLTHLGNWVYKHCFLLKSLVCLSMLKLFPADLWLNIIMEYIRMFVRLYVLMTGVLAVADKHLIPLLLLLVPAALLPKLPKLYPLQSPYTQEFSQQLKQWFFSRKIL